MLVKHIRMSLNIKPTTFVFVTAVVVFIVAVVYVVVFVANWKNPKKGSAFTYGKNMMYLTAGEGYRHDLKLF